MLKKRAWDLLLALNAEQARTNMLRIHKARLAGLSTGIQPLTSKSHVTKVRSSRRHWRLPEAFFSVSFCVIQSARLKISRNHWPNVEKHTSTQHTNTPYLPSFILPSHAATHLIWGNLHLSSQKGCSVAREKNLSFAQWLHWLHGGLHCQALCKRYGTTEMSHAKCCKWHSNVFGCKCGPARASLISCSKRKATKGWAPFSQELRHAQVGDYTWNGDKECKQCKQRKQCKECRGDNHPKSKKFAPIWKEMQALDGNHNYLKIY